MIEILLIGILGVLFLILMALNTLKRQNYIHMEMIRKSNNWNSTEVKQLINNSLDEIWPSNIDEQNK